MESRLPNLESIPVGPQRNLLLNAFVYGRGLDIKSLFYWELGDYCCPCPIIHPRKKTSDSNLNQLVQVGTVPEPGQIFD